MRLSGTKTSSVNQYNGLGDQLYDLGGAKPTLDLNFSSNESLVDSVTGKTLVDHTRQSSATYVDGDGVIKTAVTNLVLQSEDFSTSWSTSNASVTVNDIAAPDGSITADKVVVSSPGFTLYQTISGSFAAGSTYTVSLWIKATGSDIGKFVRVGLRRADATPLQQQHNIVALTGDWQRVSQSITWSEARTAISVEIRTDFIPGGDPAADNFYVWGAQLEQSSTVGQYVKTTTAINSAPRFDHDPTTGESLGLLVEEARTNSIRNNTMVGAVAGTPGTLPTNWSGYDAGLTREIVGTGIDSGISYIDIRYSGTSTGAQISINFGENTEATVANGQSWASSVYVALIGGSLSNISQIYFGNNLWSNSGNTYVGEGPGISNFASQLTSSMRRFTGAGTISIAAATSAKPYLSALITNGAAIDITLRIGLPQLEQGAFATSVIPTSTATVTRAADVTSITGRNFGSVNLLSYSEEFDQAAWGKSNLQAFGSGSIANAITGPDGNQTADLITEDTSTGQHRITRTTSGTTNTLAYTISFFAKAGTRSSVYVGIVESPTFSRQGSAIFNLSTGVVSNFSAGSNGASGGTASITAFPNGWYRCVYSVTLGGTDASIFTDINTHNGTGINYTGDGTSGLYIWGAQLEEGSTATDYIKSDVNFTSRGSTATYYDVNGVIQTAAIDEARTAAYLPDGNGNFVSAGDLLLEGSGTNLYTWSEDFSNAAWSKSEVTVSADATAAPNGANTADQLTPSTTNAGHTFSRLGIIGSAGTFTDSVYAKANGYSFLVSTADSGGFVIYDLSTGTINSSSVATGVITAVGNGWYRCSTTRTTSGAASINYQIRATAGSFSFAGNGTSGIYLWGAQLEANSYDTSYIPTSGSTATRAADVSTSAATFGNSWYDQSEGTVLIEGVTAPVLSRFPPDWSLNDGTSANRIEAYNFTSGYYATVRKTGETTVDPAILTAPISGAGYKKAIAIQANNYHLGVNGQQGASANPSFIPTVDRLNIGVSWNAVENINSTIRRLTYWPTRLSNDTLQTITT